MTALPLDTIPLPADHHDLPTPEKAKVGDFLIVRPWPNSAECMVAVVLAVQPKLLEIAIIKYSRTDENGNRFDTFKVYKSGKKLSGGSPCDVRLVAADHPAIVEHLANVRLKCRQCQLWAALSNGFALGSRYNPDRRQHDYVADGVDVLTADEMEQARGHIKALLHLVSIGHDRLGRPKPNINGDWADLFGSEDTQ